MDIFDKRNWKIYFEWIEGKEYDQLAKKFGLSSTTIKEICTSKIPLKIRQTPWQTANSYKKWREYKKKLLMEQKEPRNNEASSGS